MLYLCLQDTTATYEEILATEQDSSVLDSLTKQDISIDEKETPPTVDVIDTTHITSHQTRQRRNISKVCNAVLEKATLLLMLVDTQQL